MNVLFVVVDSLRADSIDPGFGGRPATPFFDGLREHALEFREAHATECWTLPSHASMFTGLLPSQHGAHFQSMAYRGGAPTLAQLLAEAGVQTEIITRCPIFEGSIPGIVRGFSRRSTPLATPRVWNPAALVIAMTRPRLRRQLRDTGFFHPDQRSSRAFITRYIRSLFPSDALLLEWALERMREHHERRRPFFLFCNLFDVHAPYCPSERSLFEAIERPGDLVESITALDALGRIGSHQYLRPGFRMPERGRRALLARYHRAIELTDARLSAFWDEASSAGLLDDTLLILAADHGEGFGEHGLYCHDGSLHGTHLRVPLWIRHPGIAAGVVDDVVSLRALFDLVRNAGLDRPLDDTLLSSGHRERHPVALAEHFYYPRTEGMSAFRRTNQAAAVTADHKLILRGGQAEHYDRRTDPGEQRPRPGRLEEFTEANSSGGRSLREGAAGAIARLEAFRRQHGHGSELAPSALRSRGAG